MRWERVGGLPVSIGGAAPTFDPSAVAAAVERRAVPLLWIRGDRLLPIGTGALVSAGGRLFLATAAHVVELAGRLGDLAVPVDHGRIVRLHSRSMVLDVTADVAVISLPSTADAIRLRRSWSPVHVEEPAAGGLRASPLAAQPGAGIAQEEVIAVSGYPAERTLWRDGTLHSKPLTFFARERDGGDSGTAILAFERVARRIDGLDMHTPGLEGVSGAIAWSLQPDDEAPGTSSAVLSGTSSAVLAGTSSAVLARTSSAVLAGTSSAALPDVPSARLRAMPLGIQLSYCHGRYIRCRRWGEVLRVLRSLSGALYG